MIQLLPNLGGEEGPGWRNLRTEPSVRAQARLWALLFPADAKCLYDEEPIAWPASLGAPPSEGAWPWLGSDGIVAWIVTDDAAADRRVAGRPIAGPAPEVVRAVHDKAFAHAVARAEGLVPPLLRGCIDVLDPDALRAADAADAIDARLAAWPEWARAHFTLKPRIGSSARGRVAGEDGRLDRERLGAALARLADRGGALLEPWLERCADFSVQLHVASEGVTVLGSLEQEVAPSGVFLGHRGEIDSRGRIFSGHPAEESLREAAALVAVAARERGYAGPCGVDAFTFRDPETGGEGLRPVVELNARFTAGTVTAGLVRRALPHVKRALGLGPGERLRFHLRLRDADAAAPSDGVFRVAFEPSGAPGGPSLVFGRDLDS